MPEDHDPTKLAPDVAAKVLQADLRNTVAQVAAGQRLPEADRVRMETATLADAAPEDIERLAKDRRAALLKIWASGKRRLSPAELKELEGILPEETLNKQPLKRARYEFPLEHYCPIFDCSPRTLKGWIALGRDVDPPDLPPLDEPEKMAAWYARRKKNRVPDHLVSLAARARRIEAGELPPAACGHVTTPPPEPIDPKTGPLFAAAAKASANPPPPRAPAASVPAGQLGYVATLQRLRDAEQAAGKKYTDLLIDPAKEADAEQARRAWANITKELRAYEKDAEQILRASGELWLKSDVIKANTEIHMAIRDGVRGLLRRVRPKLVGLSVAEEDKLWLAEVDGLFARLRSTSFTSPAADSVEGAQAA